MNHLLLERDANYLWHPFDVFRNTANIVVTHADGINLHTAEGRIIKDLISSWWVNLHGHNHFHIVKAIQKQAETLSHTIFSGFTHEPAITLAERLLPLLPGEMDKLFLSDNGSTAVEVAVKMAIQYWYNQGIEKKELIAFEGGYHGDTFGAMSIAGPEPFNKPFAHQLFKVNQIAFPTEENWERVEKELLLLFKTGKIAAFVYEPMVQGVAGLRIFNRTILESILKLSKEYDVLLIADEVMTGFGRTGKLFASEYLETKPDIICLSKGITGGFLPLGATATTQKVYEAFQNQDKRKLFLHGHSYTGNPLACAAANASLDLLLAPACKTAIKQISNAHQLFVKEVEKFPKVEEASSLGTLLSITIKPEKESGYFDRSAEKAYQHFLKNNLLIRPMGNLLYISPPYCIKEEELNYAQEVIKDYLLK